MQMSKGIKFLDDVDREDLIGALFTGKYLGVVRSKKGVRMFHKRGVEDLYRLLKEEPSFLEGAFVADKVVGKAAAALMVLGGVKEVFADVISEPAYNLLDGSQVFITYALKVPHIFNRNQIDLCPLENLCAAAMTAEECLPIIETFITTQTNHKTE